MNSIRVNGGNRKREEFSTAKITLWIHMKKKNLFYVVFISILSLLIQQEHAFSEMLTIPGTGDSQKLLRALARTFENRNSEICVIIPDSTGSGGGIRAVLKGKSDLARVARPLTDEELSHDLHSILFAYSPVVFVVHPSVTGVDTIGSPQIIAIFSGQINNWQQIGGANKKLYIVNREHGDSSRTVLEQKIVGFKDIAPMAGKVFYTTPEAKETLIKYPDTIGYLPLAIVKGTNLRILHFDHIAPNKETVATGEYPLSVPLSLVWRGTATDTAQKFIHFLSSSAGQGIIENFAVVTP
jgi:phosphate transport system substrate-binding protein